MPDLEKLSREELIEMAKNYYFENEDLRLQLQVANGKLKQLNHEKYGSKSEKGIGAEQITLFDEVDEMAVQAAAEEELEAKREAKGKKRKPRKLTMNELPEDLPVKQVIHDIKDEIKKEYGERLIKIGENHHKKLIRVPSHYEIEDHITLQYAVKGQPELGVFSAEDKGGFPFPKSPVSAELLAYLMVQKYQYGVPMNRLIQGMENEGIHFKSQTVSKWMIDSSEQHLEPIYERMHEKLLEEDIINSDETHYDIFTGKKDAPEYKKKKKQTYIWMLRSGSQSERPIIMYKYEEIGRNGDVAAKFLKGFNGYLETDHYSGYNKVKGVTQCLCNVHARRYMVNLYQRGMTKNPIVLNTLEIYREIFRLDQEIHDQYGKEYEKIRIEREKQLRPLFELLFVYLETSEPYIMEKSELHRAVMYIINGKEGLVNFLKDGRLDSHNNHAEQAMKPIINNRKGSLFFGSEKGATGSCIIASVVQTARQYHLRTEEYMGYVIEEMSRHPGISGEAVDYLMPWSENIKEKFGAKIKDKKPEEKGDN